MELSDEFVIGTAQDVFGDKIYSDISETLERKTEEILAAPESSEDQQISHLQDVFRKELVAPVMQVTNDTYGADLKKRERTKETIEEAVRDHLRGFARTIPSFLMAYGDEETTLSTFDMIIPDDVFYEVTSITLDQFRFLRDDGSYTDTETGE